MCGVITSVDQCTLCARSTHDVHHSIVGVNVVIGVLVVHCELHVVRVDPVVVCDDVVVRRTLVLIALCSNHCFTKKLRNEVRGGSKMLQVGTEASQVRVADVYVDTNLASSDCCLVNPTTRVSGGQHPLVTAYTEKTGSALKQVELVDGTTNQKNPVATLLKN